jgi:hypothetical protein
VGATGIEERKKRRELHVQKEKKEINIFLVVTS